LPIVYQKTPLDLQPEDGFIRKPKHVANLIIFLFIFYIIKVVLDENLCTFVLIIGNNGNASPVQLIEIKFPTLTQQTMPTLSVRVVVIIPKLTAVKQARHRREIFPGLLIRTQ